MDQRNFFTQLRGPIIVTGAGGWLGQAALEMLDAALGEAMPGQVTGFAGTARDMVLRSGRVVAARAYGDLAQYETAPAIILHFAFRTRGFAGEAGYVETNRLITQTMQHFIEKQGAAGLFVPSSGAVYKAGDVYGTLKHEDEEIFGALARRLGFPAVIMRIFNLAGPCMNNLGGYALGSIITDILRGGPVTLRAANPVWRGYAHVADVLNIALSLLLQGAALPVFDSAGEPVEIGDLARLAGQLVAGRDVVVNRPDWQGGIPDMYLGDMQGFAHAAQLAWVQPQGLEVQIRDTAADIRKKDVLF
jgi:nucleoside-diphosphate-sugar epimerase